MRKTIGRAVRDTKTFFGWNKKSLVFPLLWFCGLLFYGYWQGVDAMKGEIFIFIAFGLIPVSVFTLLLFLFHLVRAPVYIKFEEDKRPRLRIDKRPVEFKDRGVGGGWGLQIWNDGTDRAEDCRGRLMVMEFAIPQKGQSLFRWPTKHSLQWAEESAGMSSMSFDIPGGDGAVLQIVKWAPATLDTMHLLLAYVGDEAFRRQHTLPDGCVILIVVSITSKNALPLYAVCCVDTQKKIYGYDFKILDIQGQCPTISNYQQLELGKTVDTPGGK